MIQAEFARTLEAHHHHCTQRRQCRHLAEALAREGHIEPWARQLVPILGKHGDRTNLEALTTWVTREIVTHDSTEADVVDRLYLRLAAIFTSEVFDNSVEADRATGVPIKQKRDHLSSTATDSIGDNATC